MPAAMKASLPALTIMLVNGAKDMLLAVLILAAGWMVARWIGRWARDLMNRSTYVDDTLKPLVTNFVRYSILGITLVVVLGQFGVQTTSLIAVLGATGLAIGLALQGTLSNVASGVMLLFLRPFRVHDRIKTSDALGTVQEIGLFRTTIVTDDGLYVSVPNATIFSGTITNLSRERIRRTNFTVEVDRSENLDAVQKTILECLAREPRMLKDPAPTVEVDSLGPISTFLVVQVWVENRQFGSAMSEIKKRVRHALQGSDVSAPVPVAAPAVAPWTPSPEPAAQAADQSGKKPN
ncbi:MAG: mscS [Alphaproteobacteria bacterium]|nr:mscS [Alphaproteobacteria bacterium]MDB5738989.1 mscS [Alphaproteobacteria bacterium]